MVFKKNLKLNGSFLSYFRERDKELVNYARILAERDTELVRVRLECQRLLEDNRLIKEEMSKLDPRKSIAMEKEIDHLKWQLSTVSSEFFVHLCS